MKLSNTLNKKSKNNKPKKDISIHDINKQAIKSCFTNNFYQTNEYLEFIKKFSPKKLVNSNIIEINDNELYLNVIGKKNISISNYSKTEKSIMKNKNISFLSVLEQDNYNTADYSFIEYPILFYKPYSEAFKLYGKTCLKNVKRSKKFNYKLRIIREYNNKILNSVYSLYINQMKRLKGFIFPKLFFEEFLKLPSSLLFLVIEKNTVNEEIIAYSFCFENKNSLYASIGGCKKEYFSKKANFFLYDERIKYALNKKLNIHMGLGFHNSGYNLFKKDFGAVCLKCEKFPDNMKAIERMMIFSKMPFYSLFPKIVSKILGKDIVYLLTPFT